MISKKFQNGYRHRQALLFHTSNPWRISPLRSKNDPHNKLDSKYCSLVTSKIVVDGKEVDHFELSIDIKQAITDGVIEAGNRTCASTIPLF